jgi:outer membrane protein OmpA-like peptidoglycan-associated protein
VKTDSLGEYLFSKLEENFAYVIVCLPGDAGSDVMVFGDCPMSFGERRGYMSPQREKTGPLSSSRRIDFALTELRSCGWDLPQISFLRNSLDFQKASEGKPDAEAALDCYTAMLLGYPEYMIEIGGHCSSSEKNALKLSEQRAQKIIDLLVKRGIQRERLKIKAYGSSAPADRQFEDENSEKIPETRITWLILSKDFK